MLDAPNIMKMAQNLARHAGARQALIAKNIANADVPGFKARDLATFSLEDTPKSDLRATRSSHIASHRTGYELRTIELEGEASPNGNTVSVEAEMVRGTDAKSQHDLALTVYRSSLDVLRTAISRGR